MKLLSDSPRLPGRMQMAVESSRDFCVVTIWRIRSQQAAARKISDSCTKARLGMGGSQEMKTHIALVFESLSTVPGLV